MHDPYLYEDVLGGMSIEYSDPFDIRSDLIHALSDMKSKKWGNMSKDEIVDMLEQHWLHIVLILLMEVIFPRKNICEKLCMMQ